jgi:hypothetical protein
LTGDACPTDKNIKFLPYAGPKEFYSEYVAYCKLENLLDSEYAKRETFRKGLHELRHEFRLMGAKGSFPTCEMCNNANDLLRNLKVKDQSHREIIFKLKKEHLSKIMIKTYCFFQYYNNNYRPIYHLENYLLYLSTQIHNF